MSLVLMLGARATSAQTGSIAGTVTASSDSSPIQLVAVWAFDMNHAIAKSGTTDASGAYAIAGLVPGTYYVLFTKSGYVQQAYSGIACVSAACHNLWSQTTRLGITPNAVTVTAGATVTANASLDVGGTVSGTITRASDGSTILGETVVLYDSSASIVDVNQATNTYSFNGLPPGTYYARTMRNFAGSYFPDYIDTLYGGLPCTSDKVQSTPLCRVDAGTPIVVGAGSPTITANFSLPPAASIAGRVTDASTGMGIQNLLIGAYAGRTWLATASTDASGAYLLKGLNPGTYFVRTLPAPPYVEQWYRAGCVACPGVRPLGVSASSGATTGGIDFALASSTAGISGTVTLGQTPPFTLANPPDLQIYNSDGTLVRTLQGAGSGAWSATGLPPGTYYVRSSSMSAVPLSHPSFGNSGMWVDRLYGGKPCVAADCDPRQGTPVVVTANTVTSGIDLNLEFGAQISGTTTVNSGPIYVFDARGVFLPQRVGTTSDGYHYQVFGLPAGTYYLLQPASFSWVDYPLPPAPFSSAGPGVLYQNLACDGCALTSGTPVVLAAGAQAEASFPLVSGGSISGAVRSDSAAVPPSQPLEQITVEAYSPNGQVAASTTTFADGTYTLGSLTAGTYYLRSRNLRGFIDQVYSGQTCGACNPSDGTAVLVPSGTDVTGIDFRLSKGQTISGQVLATDGTPIANAGVLLYASTPSTPSAHVSTDSSGAYLATVPPGTYFVQTDPIAGYSQQIYNGIACSLGTCSTGGATAVTVSSMAVSGVTFNLPACTSATIAPVSLAQAAVGIAYRQTLLATGTNGTIQFKVSSGMPPPGLTLDPASGVLSGMATTSGHFTFTVTVVDATGCVSSRTYTLDVPDCPPTSATVTSPSSGLTTFYAFPACGPVFSTVSSDATWLMGGNTRLVKAVPPSVDDVAIQATANTAAASRTGHLIAGSHLITVIQSGVAAWPPFGSVDSPADGAVVAGSVGITGWALDNIAVSRVQIYRDPVAGEGSQLVFVGNATFVPGARPDVAAAYPSWPNSSGAGWGYLVLTNELPNQGNGMFRFSVFAVDSDQNQTLLGTKTITAANSSATAPFGAIDTPGQGASASGSAFVNFGWALTPQPKMIPIDGSTIHVLIDGVDVGAVAGYNLFRSDVSNLFTGLKNSGGPVGYRVIDTTALSEGLHTIAWIATDDGGSATGIGSRFFTVQNGAWPSSLRANFAAVPQAVTDFELAHADATTAVPPRVNGVDLGRQAESLASLPLDGTSARTVTMTNLQALQLSLLPVRADSILNSCRATYTGYLVVNGELGPLPVGSSLDPAGTFFWHPGPAFFGTYQFMFVRTSCNGAQQRIPVTITVR